MPIPLVLRLQSLGNNVYVVWSDTNGVKGEDREIFFSPSDDNATTFDNPINLSNNIGNSTNPEVAASGTMCMLFGQTLMERRVKVKTYFLDQVVTMQDPLVNRLT